MAKENGVRKSTEGLKHANIGMKGEYRLFMMWKTTHFILVSNNSMPEPDGTLPAASSTNKNIEHKL